MFFFGNVFCFRVRNNRQYEFHDLCTHLCTVFIHFSPDEKQEEEAVLFNDILHFDRVLLKTCVNALATTVLLRHLRITPQPNGSYNVAVTCIISVSHSIVDRKSTSNSIQIPINYPPYPILVHFLLPCHCVLFNFNSLLFRQFSYCIRILYSFVWRFI